MWRGSKSELSALVAASLLAGSIALPASAFFGFSGISQQKYKPIKPPSDKPTLEFIAKVAHQPELMNLGYLSHTIGRPTADLRNPRSPVKHYYWYGEQGGAMRYTLTQTENAPGRISQSTLTVFMPNLPMHLADIESKYGVAPTKFYDQSSAPNIKYSFAPFTTVDFKQPHNKFQVSEATVAFAGYALPPLTPAEILEASTAHRTTALTHHQNGKWTKAIPALKEELAENPSDVDARIALAEALKEHSNINESIEQYRIALAQSLNPQQTDRCIQALRDMRVLPGPDGLPQQKLISLQQHGQLMKEGDVGDNSVLYNPSHVYGSGYSNPPPYVGSSGFDPQAGF
jgi:hypothetical protein